MRQNSAEPYRHGRPANPDWQLPGTLSRSTSCPSARSDRHSIILCPVRHPCGDEIDLVVAQVRAAKRHSLPHRLRAAYLLDQFTPVRISRCDDRPIDAAGHYAAVGVKEQALGSTVARAAAAEKGRQHLCAEAYV